MSMINQSTINAEEKQRCITGSAKTLFLLQGFGQTSMDQIASHASVTKQTVYRYFPSKKELLSAIMLQLQETETPVYSFSNRTIKEELLGFASYLLSFHLQPESLGLYKLMITEGAKENLFNTFKNAGPKKVLQPLVTFLTSHTSIDNPLFYAQMLATMILAPRNQLLMSADKTISKSEQAEHIEKVITLFLNSIHNQ